MPKVTTHTPARGPSGPKVPQPTPAPKRPVRGGVPRPATNVPPGRDATCNPSTTLGKAY